MSPSKLRFNGWVPSALLISWLAVVPVQAATLTVTSVSDELNPDHGCTLRGAIAAINQSADVNGCAGADAGTDYGIGDNIVFADSLAGQIVQFTAERGEIRIEKPVKIYGPASARTDPNQRVTLQGGGRSSDQGIGQGSKFRLLHVVNASLLSVQYLNFSKAVLPAYWDSAWDDDALIPDPTYAGAVIRAQTLDINACTFAGNSATYGGAVYAEKVDIKASAFTRNAAEINGGAIWAGTANVEATTFDGNHSNEGGGAIAGDTLQVGTSIFNANSAGQGGAIKGKAISVVTSDFTDNSATYTYSNVQDGTVNAGAGGAIHAKTSTNIRNSRFSNNSVNAEGGAVYSGGSADIGNSLFNSNTSYYYGGAIFAGQQLFVNASTFMGNSARQGGAVHIYKQADLSASTFADNSADNVGGAIFSYGKIKALHLSLIDNTAPSGAAVFLHFTTYADLRAKADIANSLIIGKTPGRYCAGNDGAVFSGRYNLGWRPAGSVGSNETSCGGADMIDASAQTRNQIIDIKLAENGGSTPTLALPAGSPAIGRADKTGSSQRLDERGNWVDATLDQRGFPRKSAAVGRDLGAFERIDLPGTKAEVDTNANGWKTIAGIFYPQPADMGRPGAVFAFAWLPETMAIAPNSAWVLDSGQTWRLFTDCQSAPAVSTGTLQSMTIPLFSAPVDLSPYVGSELYIGYGLGSNTNTQGEACTDMLSRGRWTKVYSETGSR